MFLFTVRRSNAGSQARMARRIYRNQSTMSTEELVRLSDPVEEVYTFKIYVRLTGSRHVHSDRLRLVGSLRDGRHGSSALCKLSLKSRQQTMKALQIKVF